MALTRYEMMSTCRPRSVAAYHWQHGAANRIESVATLGAAAQPVHVQGLEFRT
jgi:hypothetical protein